MALLLSPGTIGTVQLANRLVQLPMGTGMMRDGQVTAADVAFMEERAQGGVGLIITGAAPVHQTSTVAGRILTEAWDESGVESLRRRVQAVHAHGTKIFGQILHLGRESSGDTMAGGAPDYVSLAPSAVASPRDPSPPHEMSTAEIELLIEAYGRSAANFADAGYDGIEIQACHGYLVAQFLTPASNRRTDAYRGDTLRGRMQFLTEVIEQVRSRCGAALPVGVRVSVDDMAPGGLVLTDTLEIVDELQRSTPVDYISVTTGMRGGYVKDTTFPEGFARNSARAIRERVDVPVIVAGRFRLPAAAEDALASGDADFVGLGRALLADADWVRKLREGRESEIRPCVGLLQDCRRAVGLIGCTVHARTGRELEWGPEPDPASGRTESTRVVIAGGGPAGVEAARLAALAGYSVTLFERSAQLGGQLLTAAAAPTRAELLDFVRYGEREIRRLGVDVRCGAVATREAVLGQAPALFVCATGASPLPPAVPISGNARVVNVWELLCGQVSELGTDGTAVVIDDGSGFWHGVSAAEALVQRGFSVQLVTHARSIASTIPHESASSVLRRLRSGGVRFHTLVTVSAIAGQQVLLSDALTGESSGYLQADLVVIRTELRPDVGLAHELDGEVPAIAIVGDCSAPRRLTQAIVDANRALRRFASGELSSRAMIVA